MESIAYSVHRYIKMYTFVDLIHRTKCKKLFPHTPVSYYKSTFTVNTALIMEHVHSEEERTILRHNIINLGLNDQTFVTYLERATVLFHCNILASFLSSFFQTTHRKHTLYCIYIIQICKAVIGLHSGHKH